MYDVNNGIRAFDDVLDELGFSFGDVLKVAGPVIGTAVGGPIGGVIGAGIGSAAGSALTKKKKAVAAIVAPTTAAPTSASRVASTASPDTDDVLHERIAHIASVVDRNQLREHASNILRSKIVKAKHKQALIQKLNKIIKQLNQLDSFVHSKLNVHTKVIRPGVIDILGGKDFVSNLGR
jgi:hypothetical protein